MPNFSGPLSASPDNLTMTRRYFGFAIGMFRPSSRPIRARIRLTQPQAKPDTSLVRGCALDALAEGKPDKSRDFDRCAGFGFSFLDRLRDRLLVVEDEAL